MRKLGQHRAIAVKPGLKQQSCRIPVNAAGYLPKANNIFNFVMQLPNRLDYTMEALLAKAFLSTPGRTRGFVMLNQPKADASRIKGMSMDHRPYLPGR